MESIPCKEILSPLPQELSSVGISTLELPVILSFPTGSACNSAASSMAAHARLPDLHRFLELVSQKTSPVVLNFLLVGCSLKFCFHSLIPPATLLKPWRGALPLYPFHSSVHMLTLFGWLVVAVQADPQGQYSSVSRKKLAVSVLLRRSTHISGWTGSEVFCRKTVTEILHRAKTGCLIHHPHFGCVGFSPSFCIRYLELLFFVYLLFSFFINFLPLTLLSVSVFQSIFLDLFDYGLNLHQRKMRPQGSHVRCTEKGRFLDIGSCGSSESLTGLENRSGSTEQLDVLQRHRSGREWRCTFPTGLAGVGLVPGWFNEQQHVCLCWNASHQRKNRGLNFLSSKSKTLIFQEVTKYCKNCRSQNFFFSCILILFTLFGLQRIFLPSDSQYHESAVFVWNYLLIRLCVIVRFCSLWLFMPGWFSRDEQV